MQSLVNLVYGVVAGAGLYFSTCRMRWCGRRSGPFFASSLTSALCSVQVRRSSSVWRLPKAGPDRCG